MRKKCLTCGKKFEGNKTRSYCCNECRKAAFTQQTILCAWCGNEFISTPNAKYCSNKCRGAANYARRELRFSEPPKQKIGTLSEKAIREHRSYADVQKEQSIEKYAKVELP